MNSGDESTSNSISNNSAPITAPQAPRQETAPHNLFTRNEIFNSLSFLKHDLITQQQRVMVYWKNGAKKMLALEDFTQIADIQDVYGLYISYNYNDGSTLSGRLIDRPNPGEFSIEGGGQALAAAYACLDNLKSIRPQRARLRGFFGGRGFYRLLFWLSLVVLVICVSLFVTQAVRGGTSSILIPSTQLVISSLISIALFIILITMLINLKARFGGTRLARQYEVDKNFLTAEVGVLATVIGIPIAFLMLILTGVSLL